MTRITADLIIRQGAHVKKRNTENSVQFLRRITHIYFQEKGIEFIENLSECRNLSVLYLYDNSIKEIKNLGFASNLTHLYLQKNEITRTTGLERLERLSKLYLGYNQITVLEGFEKLTQLTELHVECQKLPPGEKLLFDPRSLEALSGSIEVLNVSGNKLDEVADLKCLRHMSHFIANDNVLNDFMDIAKCLGSWFNLTSLEIAGNPFCHKKKYRDKIILMSRTLVVLDGKEINSATRNFLQNWYASKQARRLQKKEKRFSTVDDMEVSFSDMQFPSLRQYSQSAKNRSLPAMEGSSVISKGWPLKKPPVACMKHQGDLRKYQSRLPGIPSSEEKRETERTLIHHYSELSPSTGRIMLSTVET